MAALTNSMQDARNENMALMLYTLGHVLHLNQDLSSPDHVRNDNHFYGPHRYIENFGVKTYLNEPNAFPQEQHSWSYWQGMNFSKLLDFWDRNLYNGTVSPLNNSEDTNQPTKKLGLAEWSSGNFLGEDALYNEVVWTNDTFHHFPFPSLNTSVSKSPLRPSYLKNGNAINRSYFDKIGDGITFQNHSVVNYFGWAIAQKNGSSPRTYASVPVWRVSVSLDDTNVLQAYHEQLIPKAIEYSAGILDYFFRGTMSASVIGYDTNSMLYTNLIVNTSSQPFGSGTFYIYQDDNSASRTLLAYTNWSGILPTNGSLMMTFPAPEVPTNKLLLVYQGAVGVNGSGAPFDPVDANIAIATGSFYLVSEQTLEYDNYVGDDFLPSLPATISTNLMSDDFGFAPTPGNYEVLINGGEFDDAGSIGGVASTIPGSDCGWPATFATTPITIPTDAVSVVGNHLEVILTCTDNCRDHVGWQNVSITWRAWPAQ